MNSPVLPGLGRDDDHGNVGPVRKLRVLAIHLLLAFEKKDRSFNPALFARLAAGDGFAPGLVSVFLQ